MRFLSYLATLMFAVLIAACGGGGGSPGATSGNEPVPLSTTAPNSLTLPIGSSQDFTIIGGASPYAAVSNNISVMVAAVSGSNMTLGAVAPGVGEVTIRDAKGASVTVSVTVAVRQLSTTATSAITLAVGLSGAQTYGVTGGVAPYAVTSSDVNTASGAISGNSLTITGVTPGSATIQVRDSLGSTVPIAVTVSPTSSVALFTTAPSDVTVAVGESPVYSVGGGTAPYLATSSNTGVATAVLVGNSLMINGLAPGSASIVVRDKTGTSVTVAVTVPAPSSVFTTAPPSITVAIGSSPVYTVGGGTSPYTVTSSNTTVATGSISGTSLTVNGLAVGSAGIVVRDSAGSIVTVSVTVPKAGTLPLFTTAPPSVTVALGSSASYTIGGGASPYTATSSNTTVATVSVSGNTLTIQGLVAGNANILVLDSAGDQVTVGVIVPPLNNLPLFTSAPPSVTIAVNSSAAYTVGGGSPPYTATSSNTAVASASLSGSVVTITGLAVGTANVVIRDSAGPVTIAVTVSSGQLTVSPSTVTALVGDTLFATISGGSGSYTALVTNLAVATASVSGSTLRVDVKQPAASVPIVITDTATKLTTQFTLTSATGQTKIQLSPNVLTVSELDSAPITLQVFGNNGSVTAFSSDTALLVAAASGNTVTVTTGSQGNRCVAGDKTVTISVIDSTNALATAAITISNSVQPTCP